MKFRIRQKLMLSFAVVLIITAIIGIVGLNSLSRINAESELIYNDYFKALDYAQKADINLANLGVAARDMIIFIDTPDIVAKQAKAIEAYKTDLNNNIKLITPLIASENGKAILSNVNTQLESYFSTYDKVIAAANKKNISGAVSSLNILTTTANQTNVALDALIELKEQQAKDAVIRNQSNYETTQLALLILLIVGVLTGFTIAFFLSRSISNASVLMVKTADQIATTDLTAFSNAIAAIASGDLTHTMTVETQLVNYQSRDEMGELAVAFNTIVNRLHDVVKYFSEMTISLRDLLKNVQDNADLLNAAAEQMAGSAQQSGAASNQITSTIQDITKGLAQQSESINHTVASVEEVSIAIGGVAKGAQDQSMAMAKASEINQQLTFAIQDVSGNAIAQAKGAEEAVVSAQSSSDIVEKTIHGMQRIREKVSLTEQKVHEMGERSGQIGAILETIDDIASQTNMLALNAAIEAARAGEHGKGFAVVADEVRKLAEKSAAATKEIASLVDGIQSTVSDAVQAMRESSEEVENGNTLAIQSGDALAIILEAAMYGQKSGELISSASARMISLSDELSNAMDSVSAVVEENTAATEEMSAAAGEVNRAIENIASISEENSAATEEISASAEEMNAQVEEVNASAQSLAEMARKLQTLVSGFKLE